MSTFDKLRSPEELAILGPLLHPKWHELPEDDQQIVLERHNLDVQIAELQNLTVLTAGTVAIMETTAQAAMMAVPALAAMQKGKIGKATGEIINTAEAIASSAARDGNEAEKAERHNHAASPRNEMFARAAAIEAQVDAQLEKNRREKIARRHMLAGAGSFLVALTAKPARAMLTQADPENRAAERMGYSASDYDQYIDSILKDSAFINSLKAIMNKIEAGKTPLPSQYEAIITTVEHTRKGTMLLGVLDAAIVQHDDYCIVVDSKEKTVTIAERAPNKDGTVDIVSKNIYSRAKGVDKAQILKKAVKAIGAYEELSRNGRSR